MKHKSLTYIGAFGGKIKNGQTVFSENFVNSIKKLGLDLHSINSQTFYPNIGTRRSKLGFFFFKKYIQFLFKVFFSRKTDIAIISMSLSEKSIYKFLPALLALKLKGQKSFVMMHDGSPANHQKKYNLLTKKIFRLVFENIVDGNLVLGKSQKHQWEKLFPKLKIVEIYGARKNPNITVTNDRKRLTYISHFFASKGQFDLIKVWDKVNAKLKKNFILTLAGGNQDEAYLKKILENQRDRLEIIVDPSSEDIEKILTETELFLMPSTYDFEAQPAVLIEAMSFKAPIIAYEWAGIPDLVNDRNGSLVRPNDIDEFTSVVETYLTNKELRATKSINSYKYYLSEYDLKKWHEKLKIILESI